MVLSDLGAPPFPPTYRMRVWHMRLMPLIQFCFGRACHIAASNCFRTQSAPRIVWTVCIAVAAFALTNRQSESFFGAPWGRTVGVVFADEPGANPLAVPEADPTPVYFETHIRPLLKTHCFHCHGEADHKESGLDLRLARLMQAGGEGGPAVVPHQPEASMVWNRVEAGEMPPGGKTLSASEKELLHRWIATGAKTKREEPLQPMVEQWTEEERSYWLFQPVQVTKLETLHGIGSEPLQSNNPVDLFLLQKMQPAGLTFSPSADRPILIRRLALDLIGVPPTPEEVAAFVNDASPDAYERLVDRMLADPRYGEHWGRHWLDVAGYADSDGYTEQDIERPWAYQYRDYVIRAFNDDLPIDKFVVEQMAGDELVPQPWENLSQENIQRLAATGFLRTAPDGTGQEGVDPNVARNDIIAETIKIVSGSLLGLTVGCAQCHDHRYDPISQLDYYRLRAILEPGLDWKQWRDKPAKQVNLWTAEERQKAADVDKELSELEGKRVAELDTIVADIFEKEVMKLPEDQREAARTAKTTAADKRTPEQQKLMRDYPSLNVDRGSAILYDGARINEFNKKYETQQAEIKAKRPADRYLASFSEVPNQAPATFVFFRGDIQQPRDTVLPGGLSILGEHDTIPADDPAIPTTGRRLAFARRLVTGVHPLFARSTVNRIWMHHFGRGIASMPGDLGVLGDKPTHAELLDYLANQLVEYQWSRKRFQRMLLTSHAYRQASLQSPQAHQVDPENRLLSHRSFRRLQAESVRDAMLSASGMVSYSMFGKPVAVNPDEVGQIILGNATRDGNGILVAKQEETESVYRRSVYAQVRRSMPLGVLEPFDPAATSPNCDRRGNSTVATQSLLMMNNSSVIKLSEHYAKRVQREVGEDPREQVRRAWSLAFGTLPSDEQLQLSTEWLIAQRNALTKPAAETVGETTGAAPVGATVAAAGTLEPAAANLQSLALYCQALYSSNAFLYVD